MSESPKEKNQTLGDFFSLADKIEKIVASTPDEKIPDKLIEDVSEGEHPEIEQTTETQQEKLLEVEQQTVELGEGISGAKEETTERIDHKKMEDLIRVEKELIEFYSDAKIMLSDFYYKQEERKEEEIINGIKHKIQSIDKISIKKKETLGLPFALCKLDGRCQAILPIEIDKIKLPTLMMESSKNIKLLHVTDEEHLDLTENEKKHWDQAFTRFQLKLTQLIGSRAKKNLTKSAPKMKLVQIDSSRIHQYIKEYQEKMSNLHNYQQQIIEHLQEIEYLIVNENSFWKNDKEFNNAKKELRKQLIEFEEKQKKLSRESQVEFVKLKRIQKKLDARTKKYKIEENRNKKISREEKEQLIKEVRGFQEKKAQLLENIEHTKRMEETLRKWVEIISHTDMKQVNESILKNYSEDIVKRIQSFTQTQDVQELFEDSILVEADIEDIIVHVIYIPTIFYTFKAKQGEKNIEGKAIFLSPTHEIILLNPTVV